MTLVRRDKEDDSVMTRNACSSTAPPVFARRFTAETATPGQARKATREFLHHRATEDEIDTAVLLVSEIATNSLIASGGIEHARISLTLRAAGTLLFAGMIDAAPGFPKFSKPAPGDESGYGLFIVSQLSHRHGWFPMSDGQKCTYFLLNLDGNTGNR